MNIDETLVQNLINETIGPEYEIHKISDSNKYVFISWKHRNYYIDDERGHRIGVGPIVYNKTTKEYKLLGSGDLIVGDYMHYINEDSQEEENKFAPLIYQRLKLES